MRGDFMHRDHNVLQGVTETKANFGDGVGVV